MIIRVINIVMNFFLRTFSNIKVMYTSQLNSLNINVFFMQLLILKKLSEIDLAYAVPKSVQLIFYKTIFFTTYSQQQTLHHSSLPSTSLHPYFQAQAPLLLYHPQLAQHKAIFNCGLPLILKQAKENVSICNFAFHLDISIVLEDYLQLITLPITEYS